MTPLPVIAAIGAAVVAATAAGLIQQGTPGPASVGAGIQPGPVRVSMAPGTTRTGRVKVRDTGSAAETLAVLGGQRHGEQNRPVLLGPPGQRHHGTRHLAHRHVHGRCPCRNRTGQVSAARRRLRIGGQPERPGRRQFRRCLVHGPRDHSRPICLTESRHATKCPHNVNGDRSISPMPAIPNIPLGFTAALVAAAILVAVCTQAAKPLLAAARKPRPGSSWDRTLLTVVIMLGCALAPVFFLDMFRTVTDLLASSVTYAWTVPAATRARSCSSTCSGCGCSARGSRRRGSAGRRTRSPPPACSSTSGPRTATSRRWSATPH